LIACSTSWSGSRQAWKVPQALHFCACRKLAAVRSGELQDGHRLLYPVDSCIFTEEYP
jgi:hypothetical protein